MISFKACVRFKMVLHGFQRMVVSAIMEVTTYGSMLDPGLLSSKYPLPAFSVSLPTLTEEPRFATPCMHNQIVQTKENSQP